MDHHFTFDAKSNIWLEPFSLLLNTIFPVEWVFIDWFKWQEQNQSNQMSKQPRLHNLTSSTFIETGSQVEGFCIPQLFLSKTEELDLSQEQVHWSPDRDSMKIRSCIEQKKDGADVLMFNVEHVEDDKRYVKLILTTEWKEMHNPFKNSTFLHQCFLLPSPTEFIGNPNKQTTTVHGPVKKFLDEVGEEKFTIERDKTTVFTYPCAWPEHAMEWLVRPRYNGWPSKEMISDILDSSCHIAPVGRGSRLDKLVDAMVYRCYPTLVEEAQCKLEKGEMDGMEWRISFSVAENKLSSSIQPVPRHVMVLLKMIKKLYLAKEEVICTYHLKNLLFWEVENQSESFWNERNTAKCLLHLLDRLQVCLEQGKLPHYFIPESNLLASVEKEELIKAAKEVETVRINILAKTMSLFRRIRSQTYFIQHFIHFLHDVEKHLQQIQDGSKTQEEVKELYTSVLYNITLQLFFTTKSKLKDYGNRFDFPDDTELYPRLLLPVYIYQSAMSRKISEMWAIKEDNTKIKNDEEFLKFVLEETKVITVIDDMPSVKDMCMTYFKFLQSDKCMSNGIPYVLKGAKEIYRISVGGNGPPIRSLDWIKDGDFENIVASILQKHEELKESGDFPELTDDYREDLIKKELQALYEKRMEEGGNYTEEQCSLVTVYPKCFK